MSVTATGPRGHTRISDRASDSPVAPFSDRSVCRIISTEMERTSPSEVLPGATNLTNRAWRVGVALSVLVLIALVVLDVTSKSFSSWWVRHVVVTAVLIGVLTGFVAGLVLDRHARDRERIRRRFLREQAHTSLCDAAAAARSAFDYADITRLGAGLPATSQPEVVGESSLVAASRAVEDFKVALAELRGTLEPTRDDAFLNSCDEYAKVLSDAVLLMERDRQGHDVSRALDLAPGVIAKREAYFAELGGQLRAAASDRVAADVDHLVGEHSRSVLSLKQRLELWMAERYMANMARRAQRVSNEGEVPGGEAPDSERDR